MKNKTKQRIFLILAATFILLSGIYGCSILNKHFKELKGRYSYDKENGVLLKFQSELEFEKEEILSYSNKKTSALKTEIIDFTLQKRDSKTGEFLDYEVKAAYVIQNDKLLFTEIPLHFPSCDIFTLNNKNAFVAAVDDENAFLVNINDASSTKIFDDDNISLFKKNSETKLIYAKIISVSPDGRYIIYTTNRNYIDGDSPDSLDIYSCEVRFGTETKLMNFDNKEFLFWEKSADSQNFLFRELREIDNQNSDILSYSITDLTQKIFYKFDSSISNTYKISDEQYIYVLETSKAEEDSSRNITIHLFDIYSNDKITVNAKQYSTIWDVKVSENKEYIAFSGSYVNIARQAIPEIVTVNLETQTIVAHYEQSENNYVINSFFWLPDNILGVNFQNTINLHKDLCRLLDIKHK